MNKYNKALFKLGIATWLSKSMQESQFYQKIDELLEAWWKWVEHEDVLADDLYSLLDDGTEFGGAFVYMQEDDPKFEARWNCIFEAGASIASLAYECEGADYKPALLEEIDAEQEEFFNEQLRTLIGNQIQSLDNFKNYLSVDKEKNKEKILEKLSQILD